jgi:hypothetical protein
MGNDHWISLVPNPPQTRNCRRLFRWIAFRLPRVMGQQAPGPAGVPLPSIELAIPAQAGCGPFAATFFFFFATGLPFTGGAAAFGGKGFATC